MIQKINWWNLKLGDAEKSNLIQAFENKKLSYNSVGKELEKNLAEYFKVKHCLLTTSGSAALYVALKSLGIKSGDEVIVPNRTFQATANAAVMAGASVKLAEVNDRGLISLKSIEELTTFKTKVIIPVHLNGRACDMQNILNFAKARKIAVVEDSAQAFASQYQNQLLGTLGDMGCFSMGVTKFITSGQGGFILTNSDELYQQAQNFIFHAASGNDIKQFNEFGFNFRQSDLLSSIALSQFKQIESKKNKFLKVYQTYAHEIKKLKSIRLIENKIEQNELPIWIEILSEKRDQLFNFLKQRNIETSVFYPSLHKSAYLEQANLKFPQSDIFADQGLILPCGPDIQDEEIQRVLQALASYVQF